ncbi:hypothetical protein [Bdellovibrio reynosensis]|uniref:Polysaccharide biosynthesis protein C-terminal domain-containing protein n=1 Tax=Bdellovibrio reynosensis TaxID=2835041 RepID=A0ABY4C973_9BACT|nr:hypothetical protein [Bdellovibrio reynosensis]UOF01538.1 hypothetical protein MNR06_01040 [Bdellovibrio reynosensis]
MILACTLITSLIGAQLTYFLIHKKHLTTVRASAAPALIFSVIITTLPIPFSAALRAGFLGATFVGMTDKSRLGWKRVAVASFIYGLVFYFLLPLVDGFGGGLGAAAFTSCGLVFFLDKAFRRYFKNLFLRAYKRL